MKHRNDDRFAQQSIAYLRQRIAFYRGLLDMAQTRGAKLRYGKRIDALMRQYTALREHHAEQLVFPFLAQGPMQIASAGTYRKRRSVQAPHAFPPYTGP